MPTPGDSLAVAEGVYWLRMPLPYALDHINLWMLEDGNAWAIVDCGLGNEATRDLWHQVLEKRLGGRPVSRVIATHHHPDHVGNAGWLTSRFNVPLWTTQGEYLSAHANIAGSSGFAREQLVSMYQRNGMDASIAEQLRATSGAYGRGVQNFPTSYRRVFEHEKLLIGGREWRVIMGYGHAPEHAALYCGSLGVLISGDMVLPRISTNVSVPASQPTADPLGQFLESLLRYADLPPDTLVLPSHGLPFQGVRERIVQLQEHHEARLGELAEACSTPQSAFDVIGTLFRRKLDTHQMFFAMGEAMAHLHYLYERGAVERFDEGVIRYVRH
jgi:glyoxylase-like metal-dependent hydrolase (beta-lactamase superfamily II)